MSFIQGMHRIGVLGGILGAAASGFISYGMLADLDQTRLRAQEFASWMRDFGGGIDDGS
jgi:hypothetical protein